MSPNEKDSSLPSYEDSIHNNPSSFSRASHHITRTHSPPRGQQLLDRLTLVRAQHIRSVINEHILPLVEQQALYGIAQTTIAMIPSDIPLPTQEPEKSEFSFDTGNEKRVQVIGFSSDDEPQLVKLEGQMNRTEFWRPQSIILELERALKDSLDASPTFKPPSPAVPQQDRSKQPRRKFFGRVADAINPEGRSPSGDPDIGIRAPGDAGQVLVKVRLEEICLRTVNEFGLYDTMSKQCIIIRVDASC